MTVKITYFVHGTSLDNENEISSGWFDVELSELGTKQASDLREQTKEKNFDAVYCSDLKRTSESAKLAFEGRAPIILDARLRECNYGVFNAEPSSIVEPLQEKCISARFPEGESYEDVKARISNFLAEIKENHEGQHIAIVSHKAPQLALDVLLLNKTWQMAFDRDWRKTKSWKPGWDYELN